MSHPMLPVATLDEQAEQVFVRDLKGYLRTELDPSRRAMAEAVEARALATANAADPAAVRAALLKQPAFRAITLLQRESQELLWSVVGSSIDRQLDTLDTAARIDDPIGSLTLAEDFEIPGYITARDTHLMPGGFGADEGGVRQGALMDRGGAVYMMGRNGRNGGLMNDGRAHSIVAHLYEFFPDIEPRSIFELGCGVGNTAVGVAHYFPDARLSACDLGASVLRYAHARAEHLGVPIHFHQAKAEATGLPAESFDFVYTSAVFHEVDGGVVPAIFGEAYRLLRPGGVMINLDVSGRWEELTTWQQISGEFDQAYNNEIGWQSSVTADYEAILRDAGFVEARTGYQPSVGKARRGEEGFHSRGYPGVGAGWYMSSGRKPA